MPGLAKALRNQAHESSMRPDRFFDTPHMAFLGVAVDDDSRAIIHVGLDCTPEEYADYCQKLNRATEARIRCCEEDDTLALDLFRPRHRPLGRVTTDIAADCIAHLAAAIDASDQDVVGVLVTTVAISPDDCAEIVFLPVSRENVTIDEFYGDPIVIGTGEYCATAVNVHDGAVYVQRFETIEEAKAQVERNRAVDLPFAGAALD